MHTVHVRVAAAIRVGRGRPRPLLLRLLVLYIVPYAHRCESPGDNTALGGDGKASLSASQCDTLSACLREYWPLALSTSWQWTQPHWTVWTGSRRVRRARGRL
jgi:hypothetical protein